MPGLPYTHNSDSSEPSQVNVISEDEHCDLGVITGNDSIPQSVSAIDRDLAGAACLEVQRTEDKRKRQGEVDGKPFTEVNGPIARPVQDEQDDGQIGYTYTGKGKGRAQALSQDLGEYGGQTSAIAMPQLSDLDLYKCLPGRTSAHTAPMATENPSEVERQPQEVGLSMKSPFSFPGLIQLTGSSTIEQMEHEVYGTALPDDLLMPSFFDLEHEPLGQTDGFAPTSWARNDLANFEVQYDPYAAIHPDLWHEVAGPSSSTKPVSRAPSLAQHLRQLEEEMAQKVAFIRSINPNFEMPSIGVAGSARATKKKHGQGSDTYVGKGKGRAD